MLLPGQDPTWRGTASGNEHLQDLKKRQTERKREMMRWRQREAADVSEICRTGQQARWDLRLQP